jgi:aminoglycoside phosphotransferase (APT) family kinase protein
MTVDPIVVLGALGWDADGECRPVTGGWASQIWRFRTRDGSEHSLRLSGPGNELGAAHETAALRAAAGAGLPVPEIEASGTWEDRPAMVLSWLPGITLVEAASKRPWLMWSLGRRMGQLQARIHSVPVPRDLSPGRKWVDRLGSAYPEVRALVEAQAPDGYSFTHMDFHPLNLLSDGKRITGVLDWATALVGDRRADLAVTTVLMKLAPIPPGPMRPVLQAARNMIHGAWWRGYTSVAEWPEDMAAFNACAAAIFVNETFGKLGRDGVWAQESDYKPFERWIKRWREKARTRAAAHVSATKEAVL